MSLIDQLSAYPCERVALADGAQVQFRRVRGALATDAVTHVLLHGIGSASGSWLAQLQQVAGGTGARSHVLAWDAPGYGASSALAMASPRAADYATRLWAWLDALAVTQAVTLVGHSLGALMAAAAAVQAPSRVARLILLAPAQGYAHASAELREKKLSDRLANLAALGPAGIARKRAGAMLSAEADASQRAFVEHVMAQIDPAGYTQAARMLASGDLPGDLRRVACPVTIANGESDTITPPQAARALALAIGAPYVSLGAVGHSCALQAGAQVNRLLGLQEELA
ncbi:MAG: alpha/beta fold hydrolase [Burkholderiaceae bacterium]|nr:alpha/beta fold hydrolase [Rhodoferax sp.]MCB2003651.1 alpha/beta fold hydrolase [Rhodoferax sp.]MCW5644426.1 alpha/beta fold hydrolase [Rhodoferax sp.]